MWCAFLLSFKKIIFYNYDRIWWAKILPWHLMLQRVFSQMSYHISPAPSKQTWVYFSFTHTTLSLLHGCVLWKVLLSWFPFFFYSKDSLTKETTRYTQIDNFNFLWKIIWLNFNIQPLKETTIETVEGRNSTYVTTLAWPISRLKQYWEVPR